MTSVTESTPSRSTEDVEEVIERLINWFKNVEKPVVVAFSGGVDSSVVLAVACKAISCENVVAVTASSPIRFEEDILWARKIALALGVKHVIVETNELGDQSFVSNPVNRCYICKRHLARKLLEIARELNARTVVDGTNASDINSYRPGIQAFKELGIRSPLAELGIGKDDVRLIAKALQLPNWDRPSATCLATRIPYGEPITIEKISRIAKAEEIVKKVAGVKIVRVRDHGLIARIEVGKEERRKLLDEKIMDTIAIELKKLGYVYVTLDLLGYRSGSLDELLVQP